MPDLVGNPRGADAGAPEFEVVRLQARPRPDARASERDWDVRGCERARARTRPVMEEIARVYAEALFEAAKDNRKLDQVHDQLGEVTDAIVSSRDLQVFLFSPYFSSSEKRDGIHRVISGAEPELVNFLELLAEKHRMPVLFRIRRRFDEMWARERGHLGVRLTSAVELPAEVVDEVGREIEKQTGQTIELESDVDENILGGLVLQVGNMVLDASVRNRLERLRKEVAKAA
jgi:F-type H+-transporting ATPase subunit delta